MLDSDHDDFMNSVYRNIAAGNDLKSAGSEEFQNLSMVGDFETQQIHPIEPYYNEKNFFNILPFESECGSFAQDFCLHPLQINGDNFLSAINLREPSANFNKTIKQLYDEREAECFFSLRQPDSDLNLRSNIFQRVSSHN
jgi:hypothetical protein